jgi:hypothetical protein
LTQLNNSINLERATLYTNHPDIQRTPLLFTMSTHSRISVWTCDKCDATFEPGTDCFPCEEGHACLNCAAAVRDTWKCCICADEYVPGEMTCIPMGSQNACFACLRERMDKMIESEEHYPPVFDEFMLRPWDFEKALFGDEAGANDYFRRFEAKLKEYEGRGDPKPER